MSFYKKTIKDVDLRGKRVLLRADYNVPLKNGVITDDYRLQQSLPTILYMLEHGASVVIMSHLGRPEGKPVKEFSLAPIAKRLGELLKRDVRFAADCKGQKVLRASSNMKQGDILLLENVRFYPEEENDDEQFARDIIESCGAELFVQDGFGVVHRAHASTDAIARQSIMAVAGLLLEREVDTITRVMEQPERPLVAVVGGAKIKDKIEILERLLDLADLVAVGGAMANDFLVAEGLEVGNSLVDDESIATAKKILARAREIEKRRQFSFLIPVDAVVSNDLKGAKATRVVDLNSHSFADIEAYPRVPSKRSHTIAKDEMILDIGPISAARISGAVSLSHTVIWNGTMGVTETKGINGRPAPFAHATKMIVEAIIGASRKHGNRPFSVVGGGDTVGYVENEGLVEEFDHVSTGGGASLELMSGKTLPGVQVLWDKG